LNTFIYFIRYYGSKMCRWSVWAFTVFMAAIIVARTIVLTSIVRILWTNIFPISIHTFWTLFMKSSVGICRAFVIIFWNIEIKRTFVFSWWTNEIRRTFVIARWTNEIRRTFIFARWAYILAAIAEIKRTFVFSWWTNEIRRTFVIARWTNEIRRTFIFARWAYILAAIAEICRTYILAAIVEMSWTIILCVFILVN